MAFSEDDATYMQRAVRLARRGGGWVNPNPQVGCVIARDGRVIAEGFHERFGGPHAERRALAHAKERGEDVAGATVYVTLEPCAHHGKTPPCADALVEARPARVVIGSLDPNAQVAGRGVALLAEAGIEVEAGLLEDECRRLNRPFFHYITTGLPYVIAKYAMTLDGRVATASGDSRWVSGAESRAFVHRMRSRYAAIMVGIGTVLADDPMLTARIEDDLHAHQPLRIVCDARLATPLDAKVVTTAHRFRTLIATCEDDRVRIEPYEQAGVEVVVLPHAVAEAPTEPRIDLARLLRFLGERGIDSVMVEGGPRLLGSLVDLGAVDEVAAFVAPSILGEGKAPGPIAGVGASRMADAIGLSDIEIERFGADVLIRGMVVRHERIS